MNSVLLVRSSKRPFPTLADSRPVALLCFVGFNITMHNTATGLHPGSGDDRLRTPL
jgi:hypothetical protein